MARSLAVSHDPCDTAGRCPPARTGGRAVGVHSWPTLLDDLADRLGHDGGAAAEVAVVLGTSLCVAGRLEEGHRQLWAALGAGEEHLEGPQRATAVHWFTRTARLLGRYERAGAAVDALLGDSLGTGRGLQAVSTGAVALLLEQGAVSLWRGTAGGAHRQTAARLAAHPDPSLRAQALAQLALMAAIDRDGSDEANRLARTAGRLADALPERGEVARDLDALCWVAEAERCLGAPERAVEHYRLALGTAEQHRHSYPHGLLAVGLGRAEIDLGDPVAAAGWAERAREAATAAGTEPLRAAALALHSQALHAAGDAGSARETASEAVELAEPFDDVWARYARRCLARVVGGAAGTVARDVVAASTAIAAPAPDANRPALTAVPARAPAASAPSEHADPLAVLSSRETEIAELVGAGRTNQQIASALELSPKTVETYLARIFRKLRITSRASVALLVGRATRKG